MPSKKAMCAHQDPKLGRCNPCQKALDAAWRLKNKDKIKVGQAAYRRKNREKIRHRQTHSRKTKPESYGERKNMIFKEKVSEMLSIQSGLCSVCMIGIASKPYADHDHTTKVVRSMLCQICNVGLGHFLDDPNIVDRAAAYLRAHQEMLG